MLSLASAPVSKPANAAFILGQNTRGQWVIKEVHGLMEGLFINRKEAVRFALYESGLTNPSVLVSTSPLEMEALR